MRISTIKRIAFFIATFALPIFIFPFLVRNVSYFSENKMEILRVSITPYVSIIIIISILAGIIFKVKKYRPPLILLGVFYIFFGFVFALALSSQANKMSRSDMVGLTTVGVKDSNFKFTVVLNSASENECANDSNVYFNGLLKNSQDFELIKLDCVQKNKLRHLYASVINDQHVRFNYATNYKNIRILYNYTNPSESIDSCKAVSARLHGMCIEPDAKN